MNECADLIGPDFLARVAEQQLANGLETDAAAMRANARAWNADRAALAEANYAIAQLERDLRHAQKQLRDIGQAALQAAA